MVSRKKSARKQPKKRPKSVILELKITILMVAKIVRKYHCDYLSAKSAVEVQTPA
jgi:hypothetical protein